jgi:hypothetical protein
MRGASRKRLCTQNTESLSLVTKLAQPCAYSPESEQRSLPSSHAGAAASGLWEVVLLLNPFPNHLLNGQAGTPEEDPG